MKLLGACVMVIGLVLSGAVAASAAPQDLAPHGGIVLDSPFPSFSWSLPAGESDPFIYVAMSPKVDDEGQLTATREPLFVTEKHLAGRLTSDVDRTRPYAPGTYYWQVSTWDAKDPTKLVVSPVRKFVVPAIFELSGLRAEADTQAGTLVVGATLRCNIADDRVFQTMRVYDGSRLLYSGRSGPYACNYWQRVPVAVSWTPRDGQVRDGAKLTVRVRQTAGDRASDWCSRAVVWR